VNCELTSQSLHGYLDGELDAVRAAEFERHLESCAECIAELEAQESLRASLQQAQLRERAPSALRKKVLHSLPKPAVAPRLAFTLSWQWLAAAALVLLAIAAGGWRLVSTRLDLLGEQRLSAEIVDAHVRSLQPGHLSDVISTDQHTVKPWFNGKVDFAVPVRDFADEGFPLQGGRLEVIDGKSVAALIYGRRKHEVNLFVWPEPSSGDEAAHSSTERGYQLIRWRKGGMQYWLASDLALPDLEVLQHLLAQ
jgi:mycothiol system anti-sigma-R factor